MKTPEQAKHELSKNGVTVADWSRKHGFSQQLVYRVLAGKSKATYGESFRIAQALGLKEASNEQ